jgi:hypothetical protein
MWSTMKTRVTLCDFANPGDRKRREDHDWDIVTLAVRPEPVRVAVIEKRMRAAMAEADPESQHAGLLEPCREFAFARRIIERHFPHDGETIGMFLCRLQRVIICIALSRWRHENRPIDSGNGHFTE